MVTQFVFSLYTLGSGPRGERCVRTQTVVRICCIRSFGHFVARLQGSILQFNAEVGIFVSIAQSEQESLLQQAQAQFRMAQEEARRNRLMRDMAQLRLQLEVSQLEGSLQQPKAQSAMSPYLVPDTQALCHHLPVIRQLATSGRFIVIIPRTVIDGLDLLKKEHPGARDGIRYLEAEFKKGNRYIRCQREAGKSFERHKLKRQDADAWTLYKILDSCKQLTLAQGAGEEDPSGMVTIITGLPLDNPSTLSGPMQVNVEVPGHHAQSQAAPTPSSPPGPQGVLGRWYHVWLPPPHQLGLGLCPQLFPDDQRDRQHLDSLPAHLVLPVAPPGAGGRPGLPVGALPLAAARLPAARLPLPVCIVLRAHLQLHVAPRASHLLLPGLRCAQPLQPGFPELESPGLSKILRSAAFVYPFLFDNLPLFYRLGLCWGRGHSCGQEALSTSHGYHLFCALLTGFLFASHLPERLAPGRFDYIGDLPNPRIKPTPPALQAKPLPLSRWGSLQLDQTWKLRPRGC
uniref:Nonsense-mediated mRNA decay factor SMG5 n=1 Tax=Capra hircus TaxID=9925 RepID=A0A8C2NG29_CAPHI